MHHQPDDPDVVALRFDVDAIAEDLAHWCGGYLETVDGAVCIRVPAAAEHDLARRGDWIVRVSDDEIAVMSNDDFVVRFEPRPSDVPL